MNPFLQARKLLFADGSEGYFICNNSGETVSEEIGLFSDKIPYIVDLSNGELSETLYNVQQGVLKLPISLLRGEGVMVWLTDAMQPAAKPVKTEKICSLREFASYTNRRYELHPQRGPQKN